MFECERCGFEAESESEFSLVVAGLPGGLITWMELWCLKCIDEEKQKEKEKQDAN